MMTIGKAAIGSILVTLACVSAAQAMETSSADWKHKVSLYGWLPSIDGTMKYEVPPGSGTNVGIDASQILDALDGVFMGTYEASKGRWSLMMDLIYMDLSNTKNNSITLGPTGRITVASRVEQNFTGFTSTALAGYRMRDRNQSWFDLIGGVRVFSYDADARLTVSLPVRGRITSWPVGVSKSDTLVDAVVGGRGEMALGGRWSLPYYVDFGTGDSDLTWQMMAGVRYQADWGDLTLSYRQLGYDQGDKFLQDFTFSGPMMGVRFHF